MGITNLNTLDLENDLNVDGDVTITGDLTVNGSPVSGGTSVQILSTVTAVDLKTTGQTTLYTVPTGKVCVVSAINFRITAADNATVNPTVNIGITPTFDQWIANIFDSMLGSTSAVGEMQCIDATSIIGGGSPVPVFTAGEVIKADITVGATATTYTASIDVIGYLLDA